jgi:small-conductance mechanosensitive channel
MVFEDLIAEPIEAVKNVFTGIVAKLLAALIIFFIGYIIGKLVGKLLKQILHQFNLDVFFKKTLDIKFSIESLLSAFISYLIYFASLIMALNQLTQSTLILTIIFTGIISLVVISIILSIKDFIPNFVSGLTIKQKGFIREGDFIQVKNITGVVQSIDLIETKIKNKSGDLIFIPNAILTKHEIINYKIKKKK